MDDEMKRWTVIESSIGKCKDGLPFGKVLCRFPEDVQSICERCEFPIVKPYKDFVLNDNI